MEYWCPPDPSLTGMSSFNTSYNYKPPNRQVRLRYRLPDSLLVPVKLDLEHSSLQNRFAYVVGRAFEGNFMKFVCTSYFNRKLDEILEQDFLKLYVLHIKIVLQNMLRATEIAVP